MIDKELLVIGRLGKLINDEEQFQFIPNENFQPATFDKVNKLYLIFTEHRVFFVEIERLTKQNSKYWLSFKDDGVKEEFDLRKSAKLAIPKVKHYSLKQGKDFLDISNYKAYDDGEFLGYIVDFILSPAHRIIVIEDDQGNEVMIPEVDYYIKEINESENIVLMQNTQSLREL
jgi:ribosomal 30S subunit maturation factor RimM